MIPRKRGHRERLDTVPLNWTPFKDGISCYEPVWNMLTPSHYMVLDLLDRGRINRGLPHVRRVVRELAHRRLADADLLVATPRGSELIAWARETQRWEL